MKPFEPADGETARWRKLYDLVLSKQIGDEITYGEVEELIEADRAAARTAMREARRRLEDDGEQSVRTVVAFGWVVMRAVEHIRESARHLRKSHIQARAALRKVSAIDSRRDELTQSEREEADRAKLRSAALVELTGRSRVSLDEMHQQRQIS